MIIRKLNCKIYSKMAAKRAFYYTLDEFPSIKYIWLSKNEFLI